MTLKNQIPGKASCGIRGKMRRTIARDLTIRLVLVVLVASTIVISLNVLIIKSRAREQLDRKADEYTAHLIDSLEAPLWNFDEESVVKIGESCIDKELVAGVRITGAAAGILFDSIKESGDDLMERTAEVTHNGETIGQIRLYLSPSFYSNNSRQLLWSTMLTTLVIILTLIGVTGLFLKMLLRNSLTDLTEGIDRIARGDYEYTLQKAGQWEIEKVISRFNEMTEGIKRREKSLKEINRRLENEIKERKSPEEALLKEKAFINSALNALTDAFIVFDLEGRFLRWNKTMNQVTGYSDEEISSLQPVDFFLGKDIQNVLESIKIVLKEGHGSMAASVVTKKGTCIPYEFTGDLFRDDKGNPLHICVVGRDITERRYAEKALRDSEERLMKINNCFLSFGTNPDENINRLTGLCGELLGATSAFYNRIDGDMLFSLGRWNTPPDYNPAVKPDRRICHDVIKSANDQVFVVTNLPETHYARTDPDVNRYKLQTYMGRAVKLHNANVGSLCAVYQNDTDHTDGDKRVLEFIASAMGVEEERKRAREDLKESEERWRAVLENSPEPIVAYDIVGRVTYLNPAFTNVFGWTLEELRNKKIDYVPEDQLPETLGMIEKIKRGESFFGFETRRYTKKREIIDINMSAAILRDNDGTPVGSVVTLRDITDQKKLEYKLQQIQKMQALGALAGGIAHDFNNILFSIFGFTELALGDAKKGTPQHEHLREILVAGKRAKDLVKQILAFSRQADQEQKPVQVKLIVKEALKLLRASIPTIIEIEKKIKSNALVMGDSTQLHQVLMNLCTNAAHAMEDEGGLLTVSLSDVELDSAFITRHPQLKPGPHVNLTVTDTGHGMPPDVLEKIFDPFFTTKEIGVGAGMGLSVVHGIVHGHGGAVYAYSEPGTGSAFNVFLPAIEGHLKLEDKKAGKPVPIGTERILFIDDEQHISDFGKILLESLGYDVAARTSSLDALELFKTQPDAFDLVITDMNMPKMTGDDLAKELFRIRPDIPVILCTGFSSRIDEKKAMAMGIRAFALKPMLKREIAETIRRVLDGETYIIGRRHGSL